MIRIHGPTLREAGNASFSFEMMSLVILCLVISSILASSQLAKGNEVKHAFLGVGNANGAVIVAEDGAVEWEFDMPASDGWVLPNGNVLLALYGTKGFPNGGVVEVERETKKIVFQYKGQLNVCHGRTRP